MGDVEKVVLGGLVTLAVTALVQIFVIPWVQRRTRLRERWENDVDELASIVHGVWLDKSGALARVTLKRITLETGVGDHEDTRLAIQEVARQLEAAYEQASVALNRITYLVRRCSRLNPKAPLLRDASHSIEVLMAAIRDLHPVASARIDESEMEIRWSRLTDANERLAEVLDEVAESDYPQLVAGIFRLNRPRRLRPVIRRPPHG